MIHSSSNILWIYCFVFGWGWIYPKQYKPGRCLLAFVVASPRSVTPTQPLTEPSFCQRPEHLPGHQESRFSWSLWLAFLLLVLKQQFWDPTATHAQTWRQPCPSSPGMSTNSWHIVGQSCPQKCMEGCQLGEGRCLLCLYVGVTVSGHTTVPLASEQEECYLLGCLFTWQMWQWWSCG